MIVNNNNHANSFPHTGEGQIRPLDGVKVLDLTRYVHSYHVMSGHEIKYKNYTPGQKK